MLLNIVLLCLGFYMLIKGADILVDGSSSLACTFKIPTIIVGLVIVSIGTSAPEAAVSIAAGVSGSNEIAISNVIGSNIFNLLLVLGVCAFIIPLPVPRSIVKSELPLLILFSFIITSLSLFSDIISRVDGAILLALMTLYLLWLIKDALSKRAQIKVEKPVLKLSTSILYIIVGLIAIIFGGDLVVGHAKNIALDLGMSEKLIGLSIVSIGTSLPELVTSVIAARKGNVDIAVGNIVGSCIFNLLFIIGISSLITPISINPQLYIDMFVMIVASILTYYFSKTRGNMNKKEGIIFVALFLLYFIFILIRN
ncbi:MAG: calcium/sodium antiporter [Anaerorhabdus sp.]